MAFGHYGRFDNLMTSITQCEWPSPRNAHNDPLLIQLDSMAMWPAEHRAVKANYMLATEHVELLSAIPSAARAVTRHTKHWWSSFRLFIVPR